MVRGCGEWDVNGMRVWGVGGLKSVVRGCGEWKDVSGVRVCEEWEDVNGVRVWGVGRCEWYEGMRGVGGLKSAVRVCGEWEDA